MKSKPLCEREGEAPAHDDYGRVDVSRNIEAAGNPCFYAFFREDSDAVPSFSLSYAIYCCGVEGQDHHGNDVGVVGPHDCGKLGTPFPFAENLNGEDRGKDEKGRNGIFGVDIGALQTATEQKISPEPCQLRPISEVVQDDGGNVWCARRVRSSILQELSEEAGNIQQDASDYNGCAGHPQNFCEALDFARWNHGSGPSN